MRRQKRRRAASHLHAKAKVSSPIPETTRRSCGKENMICRGGPVWPPACSSPIHLSHIQPRDPVALNLKLHKRIKFAPLVGVKSAVDGQAVVLNAINGHQIG